MGLCLFKASVTAMADWMCWNFNTWSTRLLRYLNGGLAGVPWVVARNISLSCGSG